MISLFPNAMSPPTVQFPTLEAAFAAMQRPSPDLRRLVARIRSEGDKEKRKALKKHLPAVTWSGVFEAKGEDGFKSHTGYYIYDLDHLTDARETLATLVDANPDGFAAAWISPSGDGLKVLLQGPVVAAADEHRKAWRIGARVLANAIPHEVQHQDAAEEVSRLCFLADCSDAGSIHISEWYEPFTARSVSTDGAPEAENEDGVTLADMPKQPPIDPLNLDQIRDMLDVIGADIPYSDWMRLILATVAELGSGDEVKEMLRTWSTETGGARGKWSKADEKTFEKLFASAGKEKDREKVGRGTILKMAKAAGWRDWRTLLARSQKGIILECEENVDVVLRHHPDMRGRLWYDTLMGTYCVGAKPTSKLLPKGDLIEETTAWTLAAELQKFESLRVGKVGSLLTGMFAIARDNPRNFRKEWLDSLVWDGVERIKNFFIDGFGAKRTELNEATGETWIIGAAMRIINPGSDFQLMPVLVGSQGIGKSLGIAALCPDRSWFSDDRIDMTGGKAANEVLRQVAILEVSELANMRRAEKEDVKAFISRSTVRYQRSYARQANTVPASWVFIGTSNETEFLTDNTGNRRFVNIPVTGRQGDWEKTVEWVRGNREQLWAEGVRKALGKDAWALPRKVWKAAAEANEHAMVRTAVMDEVEAFTSSVREGGGAYTLRDLCSAAGLTCEHRGDEMAIGAALRRYGWKKEVKWVGGKVCRVWAIEPEL